MDRPVEGSTTGETYRDFAHEAGHMMGLDDCDGDLMCAASGQTGHVSQANVNAAVENVCGQNACPDRCCCGDGKIDKDKGEQCDPKANPNGCTDSGVFCCPYCCKCESPDCDPKYGEYATEDECKKNCKDPKICAYSYWSGCWVCIEKYEKEVFPEYDPSKIKEATPCNHSVPVKPEERTKDESVKNIAQSLAGPGSAVGSYFENERANIYVDGYPGCGYEEQYYAVIEDGHVTEFGEGELPGPTVKITADAAAVDLLASGEISMPSAVKSDLISYEGVGFFEGLKYWFADLYMDAFVPGDTVPEHMINGVKEDASVSAGEPEPELEELEPEKYIYVVYQDGEPSEPVLVAPEHMQGEPVVDQ